MHDLRAGWMSGGGRLQVQGVNAAGLQGVAERNDEHASFE
jgi:hypothetical protein